VGEKRDGIVVADAWSDPGTRKILRYLGLAANVQVVHEPPRTLMQPFSGFGRLLRHIMADRLTGRGQGVRNSTAAMVLYLGTGATGFDGVGEAVAACRGSWNLVKKSGNFHNCQRQLGPGCVTCCKAVICTCLNRSAPDAPTRYCKFGIADGGGFPLAAKL
jgi:hypothetical protein